MTDTEYLYKLYSQNIHNRLKEIVNASVYTSIADDRLEVTILVTKHGSVIFDFFYAKDQIVQDIIAGDKVESTVNDIVDLYKGAIYKKFFVTKTSPLMEKEDNK